MDISPRAAPSGLGWFMDHKFLSTVETGGTNVVLAGTL